MLARRLTRYGLGLSGGALAAALSEGAGLAQVPGSLAKLAAFSSPAAVLARGVIRAMFLAKVKVVFGAVLLAALAAGGIAYRAGGAQAAPPEKRSESKPRTELEALRRENELLKLNLEVVLEKVRALQAEVAALKGRAKATGRLPEKQGLRTLAELVLEAQRRELVARNRAANALEAVGRKALADKGLSKAELKEVEAALQALREARDPQARRRAAEALQKATLKLRELLGGDATKPPDSYLRPRR
jgi:hypothetical protein